MTTTLVLQEQRYRALYSPTNTLGAKVCTYPVNRWGDALQHNFPLAKDQYVHAPILGSWGRCQFWIFGNEHFDEFQSA
ncbi:hypothetical protein M404DRAFT_1000309 [Pisolithus tinctorius Marx 270]|uniref:Uncharacterized protein n=1 Tax=Pisolithus tinctorius Marx 270 TaxID=870435 RepID=A0A0C3J6W2_PISTI|nr:hypothetical protein M404DRAFT_1000309 [Pisolithus tinctorius Marx 270]